MAASADRMSGIGSIGLAGIGRGAAALEGGLRVADLTLVVLRQNQVRLIHIGNCFSATTSVIPDSFSSPNVTPTDSLRVSTMVEGQPI